MKLNKYVTATALILFPYACFGAMEDEPLLLNVKTDQLETSDNSAHPLFWDAQAWLGKDLNKLWLKTEGERVEGETEEAELQALYSKAVSTFWDFQVGLRRDFAPTPRRTWGVVGFQGLAPYFFEMETALFASEDGDLAFRLNAEYELLLTQRLILSPEIEMNLYQDDIPELGIGSGLTDMTAGLRLRYEIRREFAPYIGVNWQKKFGGTADYTNQAGQETSDTFVVAGIRFWF